MTLWLYLAIALNAIAVCVLLGALWVTVRGLGGISALRSELIVIQTGLERCDERITREVKTRAGLAGAAKADEERTILQQAQAELTNPENVEVFQLRPKRPIRRR